MRALTLAVMMMSGIGLLLLLSRVAFHEICERHLLERRKRYRHERATRTHPRALAGPTCASSSCKCSRFFAMVRVREFFSFRSMSRSFCALVGIPIQRISFFSCGMLALTTSA